MRKLSLYLLLSALHSAMPVTLFGAEAAELRLLEEHDSNDNTPTDQREAQRDHMNPGVRSESRHEQPAARAEKTKQTPILHKHSKPAPVAFDGMTELTHTNKLSIQELENHIAALEHYSDVTRITELHRENVRKNQSELKRIVAASRVIDTALSRMSEADRNKLLNLKDAMVLARTRLIEALVKGEKSDALGEAFNAALKNLIAEINKVQKSTDTKTLEKNEQTRINEALQKNKFAQMKDTDTTTQQAYKQWQNAQQEALTSQRGTSATGLTTLDVDLTLKEAADQLIAAIEKSKHSSEAKKNWKTAEAFAKMLAKRKAEVASLQEQVIAKVNKGGAFQDGADQMAFNSLAKEINDLDTTTLTLSEKKAYLKTSDWLTGFDAPDRSFENILAKMKKLVSKMKSAKQVKKDTTAQAQKRTEGQKAWDEQETQDEAAKTQKALASLKLTGQDLGNQRKNLLQELIEDRTFNELQSDTQELDTAIDYYKMSELPNWNEVRADFVQARGELMEALIKSHNQSGQAVNRELERANQKYKSSLNTLITLIQERQKKQAGTSFAQQGSSVETILQQYEFAQIADTDTATQAAYKEMDEADDALNKHNLYPRASDPLQKIADTIAFEKAKAAFIKAIKESKRSSTAKKNWKIDQSFGKALKTMQQKVEALKKKMQAKLASGGAFKDEYGAQKFNDFLKQIGEMTSEDVPFPRKIALLKTSGFFSLDPVSDDSFQRIFKEMDQIISEMKTKKQIQKENLQAQKAAQKEKREKFEKDLSLMKESGFFTEAQIDEFRKQGVDSFDDNTVMKTLADQITPPLKRWLETHPVEEKPQERGKFLSENPLQSQQGNLSSQVQFFIQRAANDRSLESFFTQLKKLQAKATNEGYSDFPAFSDTVK